MLDASHRSASSRLVLRTNLSYGDLHIDRNEFEGTIKPSTARHFDSSAESKTTKHKRFRWSATIGDIKERRDKKHGTVHFEGVGEEKKRLKSPRKLLNTLKNQAKKLSSNKFRSAVNEDSADICAEERSQIKSRDILTRMISNSSSNDTTESDSHSLIMTTSETDIWIANNIFTGQG